jgi:polyhydroxybutyrate depolymerase
MQRARLIALVLAAAIVVLELGGRAWPASETAADGSIHIDAGQYRAVLPPGWDRRSALPLVLYIHGYGQSSAEIVADHDLVEAVTSLGALLVVPDGIDHAWAHVGAPSHKRDDLTFLHAVVDDARERWPVNPAKIYASGFSIGGSMVWDLACHAAAGFAAFLPVSGAFWLPYPERCDGPVTLRHVHGLTDTTVPMAGRVLFGKYTQGDVLKGWDILRTTDRCTVEPERTLQEGDLACQSWTSCAGGHALELCLHGDGHDMEPAYLHGGLVWAMTRGG